MLIVCPNCATSYMIGPGSLGAGRNVRCTRCKTQWFAAPEKKHPEPAVAAFVDDVIAEAQARTGEQPDGRPSIRKRLPPAAPLDDVAKFNAALDDGTAVDPPAPARISETLPPALFDTPSIADAPSLVPPAQPAPMPDAVSDPARAPGSEDIESFASRKQARSFGRAPRRKRSRWPFIIFMLLAANAALVIYRAEVVRLLPQTASLYSALGMAVNLRGLNFEGVTVAKEMHDGVPVLVVDGKIVSTGTKPVEVPRMRLAVRNAAGQEIYSWTAQPPRSVLGAGETMPFKSRLASPPAEANSVMVRFLNARDAIPGSK